MLSVGLVAMKPRDRILHSIEGGVEIASSWGMIQSYS